MSSSRSSNNLLHINRKLSERLSKYEIMALVEDTENGDTVRTGVVITAGNIASARSRNKLNLSDNSLRAIDRGLKSLREPYKNILANLYNHLGLVVYDAVRDVNPQIVEIGEHAYLAFKPTKKRSGLFVVDKGPLNIGNIVRVHSHDRRDVLPDMANIAIKSLISTPLESGVLEITVERLAAIGELAQGIGRDMLELLDR